MKFNRNNFEQLLKGEFSTGFDDFLISEIDNLIIKPEDRLSILTTVNKDILVDRNSRKNRYAWYSDKLVTFSDGMIVFRFSGENSKVERDFTPFNGKIVLGDLNPIKEFEYLFVEKNKLQLNNDLYLK